MSPAIASASIRGRCRRIGLVAVVSFACAAACGQPADPDLPADWSLEPGDPAVNRVTRVQVRLRSPQGAPIEGARLRIEGHMSHPGMAPAIADARERGGGLYEADLTFTMVGPWTLVASGTLADGTRIVQQHELTVASSPP